MADPERAPLLPREPEEAQDLVSRLSTGVHAPSKLNGLERFLAVISILLLAIAALGYGLYAGERSKGERGDRSPSTTTLTATRTATRTTTVHGPTKTVVPAPRESNGVCLTAACVAISARISAGMDDDFEPCDDFYQFANGGWLKENPIPDEKASYGAFEQLDFKNKRLVKSIIESPPSHSLPAADQRNLEQLRTYYVACMDENEIARQGSTPVTDLVKVLIKAWRGEGRSKGFFMQKSDGRWDPETRRTRLTDALLFLHSRGIPALFEFQLEGDVRVAPKMLVLWLYQAGLSLPSKTYYKDEAVLHTLEKVIAGTLQNVYADGLRERVDAKSLAREVVAFEGKLAKSFLDVVELSDPVKTYNAYNASSLQHLLPSISFADYFAAFGPRPTFPNPVIVTSPRYLEDVVELLSTVEEETLEAYFIFQLAKSFGPLLSSKEVINREVVSLTNSLAGLDADVKPIRSEVCLASLSDSLGFSVGRYFVEEAFSGDSKAYAEDIIEGIISAFKARLPDIKFLDKKSRAAAEEKADYITHKIGYPTSPNTTDAVAIERYYSLQLPVSSRDYFGNVLRARVADLKRTWAAVNHNRDPGTWEMIPSEVNAYYNPSSNEIVFPAGILRPPFFDRSFPEYLSFGGFGVVAGHELSHAFDATGRQYDKDGKLTDWWSEDSVKRFEVLKECFLQQYGNYSIEDANGKKYYVNSEFTIGEDGADNGGLAQSFTAWNKRRDAKLDKYGNFLLPGLDFTREQLFFIAFAQVWPRNMRTAEAIRRLRIDPHSPTQFRVLGALSNSREFAKAFNCKAGDRMSRIDKCKIW